MDSVGDPSRLQEILDPVREVFSEFFQNNRNSIAGVASAAEVWTTEGDTKGNWYRIAVNVRRQGPSFQIVTRIEHKQSQHDDGITVFATSPAPLAETPSDDDVRAAVREQLEETRHQLDALRNPGT